jgi:hypothetical protein
MDEMQDAKTGRLAHRAERGSVLRSFAQHSGFKIFKDELEAIVQDKKNKWLQGTDEEAKIFRYQAQGVDLALGVLKRIILDGDLAASQLKENVENSLEPQQ